MTDFSKRNEQFERARALNQKLARYADVERRYRELEEELRELESDLDLCRVLSISPPNNDDQHSPANAVAAPSHVEQATDVLPSDDQTPASTKAGAPLSPTGRLQRGYLSKAMPRMARKLFSDRNPTIGEIRDGVAEELAYDIHRNSVKAFMKRWVEEGHAELIEDSSPTRYRFVFTEEGETEDF